MPEPTLILVVEDEYLLRHDVEDALTSGGFVGESFSTGEKALTVFMDGTKNYKALVTDVNLGDGLSGWNSCRYTGHSRRPSWRLPDGPECRKERLSWYRDESPRPTRHRQVDRGAGLQ